MILLVDDLRSFNDGTRAVVARTSEDALEHLTYMEYNDVDLDEIWLDHDLGGDDTTMPIVDYLHRFVLYLNLYPVKKIWVHTQNPVGRDNILRALRSAGYDAEPYFGNRLSDDPM